eukprot:3602955-Prymnesium_polylepis.2
MPTLNFPRTPASRSTASKPLPKSHISSRVLPWTAAPLTSWMSCCTYRRSKPPPRSWGRWNTTWRNSVPSVSHRSRLAAMCIVPTLATHPASEAVASAATGSAWPHHVSSASCDDASNGSKLPMVSSASASSSGSGHSSPSPTHSGA